MSQPGVAAGARKSSGRSIAWEHVILSLIAAIALVMVVFTVILVVLRSVSKDHVGSELTLEWLAAVFQSGRSREALINTIIYTIGSSILAMVVGVGLSFLSTRTDMPGGRLVGVLALVPILLPPFILVVGWVALADPNAGLINIAASALAGPRTVAVNINTMLGIIWITGLFLTPYVYLLVAAGSPAAIPPWRKRRASPARAGCVCSTRSCCRCSGRPCSLPFC